MRKFSDSTNFRLALPKYFLYFATLFIIFRLFQIQVLNTSRYRAEAKQQQWKGNTIPSKRGTIYSSDKYPITQSIQKYDLYYEASEKTDETELIAGLDTVIEYDRNEVRNILLKETRRAKLLTNLDYQQKTIIEGLKIPGVIIEPYYVREYPEDDMLAHLLGFVGKDKYGSDVGYYGLEQYYDGDLSGTPGNKFQVQSASGNIILWGNTEIIEPVNGSDLHITIDRNVQFLAEQKIKHGVDIYNAKSGSVIVVEPNTGKILAMANYPVFDLDKYADFVDEKNLLRNSAIGTVYEAGSVIKPITMSSAMDAGSISMNSVYNDTGPKIYSGHKIDNWDGKHHGEETMTEILQHSNNMGMAWIGTQIGDKALLDYFANFYLGKKLSIDLDGEERGLVYSNPPLKEIELANASFGQGISVTPLQVAMSFSAIANKGYLMKPYVVEEVSGPGGSTKTEPEILSRPISTQTADEMVGMLTEAVSGGEAKFFVSKKYQIAGKTGTAQVPVSGGYDPSRTNATFVGFFPSYRNFVMLIRLEEPSSPSGYAAETAVPLWMSLAEELANYYNLRPDKE